MEATDAIDDACERKIFPDSGMVIAPTIVMKAASVRTSFDLRNPFIYGSPNYERQNTLRRQKAKPENLHLYAEISNYSVAPQRS